MPNKYPGNIEKRGNTFRVRFMHDGQIFRFTIRTTDRREAQRFALRKYQELPKIIAQKAAGIDDKVRFSVLIKRFETEVMPTRTLGTQRSYTDSLKPIKEYFLDCSGDPVISTIRASDIASYLTWRRKNRYQGNTVRKGEQSKSAAELPPVGNRTLAKDRAVLHALFSFAERLELREGNPVALTTAPKYDPRDPVILSDENLEDLLRECKHNPMLTLYVLTLAEAGLRCESEALWLTWDDILVDEGYIRIASGRQGRRTKSGRGRWVPMTERLEKAFRDHFAEFHTSDSPWVFHHISRRRSIKVGDRIGSFRNSFRSAVKRAKLPLEMHQHDLRHRRVTTWLAQGASAVHVKEAMGHSDLRTTMGYSHLSRDHLKQLVR